ncbi:unnamed protein product [Meganyctiphanes norvegica]|uniref:WAP domain-containing protein n=1 Tax=Meganyctiphanes norvegica TaxID=48144 RepID=A0AAV2R2M9_MEGNR
MVQQMSSLVSVAVLLVNIVIVLSKDIPKTELCVNRFGEQVECGKTQGEKMLCPPMPRIDIYCDDAGVIHNEINTKNCELDKECGALEKCCEDVCYSQSRSGLRNKICMPGRDNMNYLFP